MSFFFSFVCKNDLTPLIEFMVSKIFLNIFAEKQILGNIFEI